MKSVKRQQWIQQKRYQLLLQQSHWHYLCHQLVSQAMYSHRKTTIVIVAAEAVAAVVTVIVAAEAVAAVAAAAQAKAIMTNSRAVCRMQQAAVLRPNNK